MKNLLLLLSLIIGFEFFAFSQTRYKESINEAWKFLKEDVSNGYYPPLDDSAWETVNIPHTWNASDAIIREDYFRGVAWYRKKIQVSDSLAGKRIYLYFEGVGQVADVYVNGQFVGDHKGGYTAFNFDITDFLNRKRGEYEVIAVKVDNTHNQSVPPLLGDFNFWGGIYRDVYLTATDLVHFETLNHASNGVFIQTPIVTTELATVAVKGNVINLSTLPKKLKVISRILDHNGTEIQVIETKLRMTPSSRIEFNQLSEEIEAPRLWSPNNPYLYTVETQILEDKIVKPVDVVVNKLGFRWYEFDSKKGFFLNGEHLKLIGVNRHQDFEGFGNAVSDDINRRDIQLIKEMGANFLRISHYPQDPSVLEMCDKLGLLVWEEIPIVNTIDDGFAFEQNSINMLREMIRQHYNHPSVIMWGYSNEVLISTLWQIKDKQRQQLLLQKTPGLLRNLEQVAYQEDSLRYTCTAWHGSQEYNDMGMGDIQEVIGWNLYQGWYSGKLTDFEDFIDKERNKYPERVLMISEYGAGSDKRIHSLKPEAFDFSVEYQQLFHEHYASEIIKRDFIAGASVWNFVDFASSLRQESMPRINNKGLVYYNREPKDIYYYYKALLTKEPFVHIASRDWALRKGIPAEERDKTVMQPVKVYSNAGEIELLHNGKSLGNKKLENMVATWNIPFVNGINEIKTINLAKQIEDVMQIDFQVQPYLLKDSTLQNIEIGVNVGSTSYFTDQATKFVWEPDKPYTQGSWGFVGGEIYRPNSNRQGIQSEIAATNLGPLFQTLREDIKAYKFDVPKGIYEIELMFCEPINSKKQIADAGAKQKGNTESQRIFTVFINGYPYLQKFDIEKDYGSVIAITKKFEIKVDSDNGISIDFQKIQGKPILNAVKITKIW